MKVILVRFILSAHRENNGISTRAAKTKDSGVKNAFYCHLQNEWRQRREGSFIRLESLMRRSGYTIFLSFKMATASDLLSHNFFWQRDLTHLLDPAMLNNFHDIQVIRKEVSLTSLFPLTGATM